MLLTKDMLFAIKDDEDCRKAISMLEHTTTEDRRNAETSEIYEILKDLVHAWDSRQPQLQQLSGAEMLRALMDAEGVTQERLAQATGMRQSNISRILNGPHNISVSSAKKFAAFFDVDISLFGHERIQMNTCISDGNVYHMADYQQKMRINYSATADDFYEKGGAK